MARGWVRSLFFVVFSYASKAALKTDWKSVDGDGAAGAVWDMVSVGKNEPVLAGHRASYIVNVGTKFPLPAVVVRRTSGGRRQLRAAVQH